MPVKLSRWLNLTARLSAALMRSSARGARRLFDRCRILKSRWQTENTLRLRVTSSCSLNSRSTRVAREFPVSSDVDGVWWTPRDTRGVGARRDLSMSDFTSEFHSIARLSAGPLITSLFKSKSIKSLIYRAAIPSISHLSAPGNPLPSPSWRS